MALTLYKIFAYAVWPILKIWPSLRVKKGKELQGRLKERFGVSSIPRPIGQIVWFHAASNGEALSALPLIEYFLNLETPPHILVTTMTVTAAQLIDQRTPSTHVTHQFIPYDHPSWVRKFHAHWQPDLVIWLESELWPNHLQEVKKKGIPAALVNARLSDKSVKGWSRAKKWFQSIMGSFDVILAQTDRDKGNIASLGVENVQSIGNLKDYAGPLPHDAHALTDLKNSIGSRPVILFASTHDPEEDIAYDIHIALKKDFPDLLSIILPRHPKRAEEILVKVGENSDLKIAQRSLKMSPRSDTDIYLADTLGETGLFFRVCPIVFIGNSMGTKPGGGHNMMEPAWFDCAIVTGDDVHNFSVLADEMPQQNALKIAKDKSKLQDILKALLEDQNLQKEMAENAYDYATQKYENGLGPIIDALKSPCKAAGIL